MNALEQYAPNLARLLIVKGVVKLEPALNLEQMARVECPLSEASLAVIEKQFPQLYREYGHLRGAYRDVFKVQIRGEDIGQYTVEHNVVFGMVAVQFFYTNRPSYLGLPAGIGGQKGVELHARYETVIESRWQTSLTGQTCFSEWVRKDPWKQLVPFP